MTLPNMYLCTFTLIMLLTFTGCQTAPTPAPKTDVAADTAAIKALGDQYTTAANSSDAAALAGTYADDGIEMAPNEPPAEGRQAIQARSEASFKQYANRLATTLLETQLAGDWAFARGNYTVTVTPKSGKPTEDSGKFLLIVKRQADGTWKYQRAIWNSNAPPPSAAGRKK